MESLIEYSAGQGSDSSCENYFVCIFVKKMSSCNKTNDKGHLFDDYNESTILRTKL